MNTRLFWLLLVFAALAVGYGILRLRDFQQEQLALAFEDEVSQVLVAEKIEDELERCLKTPNPTEFEWSSDIVDAFCRLGTRKLVSWNEIREAVASNHPEVLQQIFDSYATRNFDEKQHGLLTWALKTRFENSESDRLEVIQQWLTEDPHSSYALTARGLHELAQAEDSRGENLANKIPRESLASMRAFSAQAYDDLNAAVQRNGRALPAYHGLIVLGMMNGNRALVESSVKAALAVDPADHSIYTDWLHAEEPRWGGSMAAMEAAVALGLSHADENPLLKRLKARPYCYRAEMTNCAECNSQGIEGEKKALKLYESAAALAPDICVFDGAGDTAVRAGDPKEAVRFFSQAYRFLGNKSFVIRRSIALQDLGKSQSALDSIENILRDDPTNVEALDHKGWVYLGMQRVKDAEDAFRKAFEVDSTDRQASAELVLIYTDRMGKPDRATEVIDQLARENPRSPRIPLLRSVVDKAHCREYLGQYLKMVDGTNVDAYEERDIARAKKRLAELH